MANQKSASSENDLTIAIIGGFLLLALFSIVAKPIYQHNYLKVAYFEYRGLETIMPESAARKIGVVRSRAAIANALRAGQGNYNYEKLKPHLVIAKYTYGTVFALILGYLGYRLFKARPDRFIATLSPEELEFKLVQRYWENAPVIGRHLDKRHPFKDKLWRFPRKPWEFAYDFGIITDVKGNKIKYEYVPKQVYVKRPTQQQLNGHIFNKKKADAVFTKELGKRIDIQTLDDVLALPLEHKALIVPLLSDIDVYFNEEVGHYSKWFRQYAYSFFDAKLVMKSLFDESKVDELPKFVRSNLNMDGVDDALKKAWKMPTAREKLITSGYSNALIVQLMIQTITVKSCYFKWLKPMNRSLWYGLNNVGAPTTGMEGTGKLKSPTSLHTEGAGLFAHAEYELKAGRPEYVPRVDRATSGLRNILTKNHFINS